jgi:arylsulfatase B
MLSNMDDSVGSVLKELKDAGIQRRTLVFFISDNGGPTRELTSSNLPLRGGKGDMYEGGVRVPFLVRWTGNLPARREYHHPVISLDVYATAAAAAGAPIAGKRSIDGVNLLPYLTGDEPGRPHDLLFWRAGSRTAIRQGDWKLVRNSRRGGGNWEMFNLADDIGESNDLSRSQPEQFERLKALWQQYNGQMVEPAWQ